MSKYDDAWKDYKPIGVEGAEEIEAGAAECVKLGHQAEHAAKLCEEAAKIGDIANAQKHAREVKRLSDLVKAQADKVRRQGDILTGRNTSTRDHGA